MSKAISDQAPETAVTAEMVRGHPVQRPPSAFDQGQR
jgi:hypothetical protein